MGSFSEPIGMENALDLWEGPLEMGREDVLAA